MRKTSAESTIFSFRAVAFMMDRQQMVLTTRGCRLRAMWNALIAGVVFQHPTVEALPRELLPDYG